MKTRTMDRRPIPRIVASFCALSLMFPQYLGSETLTMVTTYPSPMGVYKNIVTTGQTLIARDAGNVGIGTIPSTTGGKVQIVADTTQPALSAISSQAGNYAAIFSNASGAGVQSVSG